MIVVDAVANASKGCDRIFGLLGWRESGFQVVGMRAIQPDACCSRTEIGRIDGPGRLRPYEVQTEWPLAVRAATPLWFGQSGHTHAFAGLDGQETKPGASASSGVSDPRSVDRHIVFALLGEDNSDRPCLPVRREMALLAGIMRHILALQALPRTFRATSRTACERSASAPRQWMIANRSRIAEHARRLSASCLALFASKLGTCKQLELATRCAA